MRMDKLKGHIKSAAAILLSLGVLMSTTGFSIYKHHCQQQQKSSYSLFIPADSCDKHDANPESSTCCPQETTQNKAASEDNCCTEDNQVHILDTAGLLNHATPQLKVITIAHLQLPALLQNMAPDNFRIDMKRHGSDASPPPLTTQQYLSLIQVFTIWSLHRNSPADKSRISIPGVSLWKANSMEMNRPAYPRKRLLQAIHFVQIITSAKHIWKNYIPCYS